jgi:hypothetical protein
VRLSLTCSASTTATSINVFLHDGQRGATFNVGGLFGGVQIEGNAAVGPYAPTLTQPNGLLDFSVLRNRIRSETVTMTTGLRAFNGSFAGSLAEGNRVSGASTLYSLLPAPGWRLVGNYGLNSATYP